VEIQPLATTLIIAPTATLGDLQAIMCELTREYPEAGARVEHGAFLALMGHAEPSGPGAYWVLSERDEATQYFVLPLYGTCTCQDHARHGTLSPCKHALAIEIVRRLERIEAEALDPTTPIGLELTDAAYAALDALGEVPGMPPQCRRCGQEPMLRNYRDGLGARCVSAELFGPNDVA
jgi:hypothetical protein